MRVLVLTSGGDAPGMNMALATLYKKYKKNLFACRAGLEDSSMEIFFQCLSLTF